MSTIGVIIQDEILQKKQGLQPGCIDNKKHSQTAVDDSTRLKDIVSDPDSETLVTCKNITVKSEDVSNEGLGVSLRDEVLPYIYGNSFNSEVNAENSQPEPENEPELSSSRGQGSRETPLKRSIEKDNDPDYTYPPKRRRGRPRKDAPKILQVKIEKVKTKTVPVKKTPKITPNRSRSTTKKDGKQSSKKTNVPVPLKKEVQDSDDEYEHDDSDFDDSDCGGTSEDESTADDQRKDRMLTRKRRVKKDYCPDCGNKMGAFHECVLENPVCYVRDKTVADGEEGENLNRALATAPEEIDLVEKNGKIIVKAAKDILASTQFGPLEGTLIEEHKLELNADTRYLWLQKSGGSFLDSCNTYLSTENAEKSNWLRYLSPCPFKGHGNVVVVQNKDMQLFFVTTRNIRKGCTLEYSLSQVYQEASLAERFPIECAACSVSFEHGLFAGRHKAIYHPGGKHRLRLLCKLCTNVIHGRHQMALHNRTVHPGQGTIPCPYCERMLCKEETLLQHIQAQHEQHEDLKVVCEICGKVCMHKKALVDHRQKTHTEMQVKCSLCGKEFRHKFLLQRHMRCHTKTFQHSCEFCGKQMHNASNLKVHLLTHSGIKPFACDEADCGASYSTKQCLQIHYRKVHSYTDENMPTISRKIPYTFEAHTKGKGAEDKVKSPAIVSRKMSSECKEKRMERGNSGSEVPQQPATGSCMRAGQGYQNTQQEWNPQAGPYEHMGGPQVFGSPVFPQYDMHEYGIPKEQY